MVSVRLLVENEMKGGKREYKKTRRKKERQREREREREREHTSKIVHAHFLWQFNILRCSQSDY